MAYNIFCRFCEVNMKTVGNYRHSVDLFEKTKGPLSLAQRFENIGLTVVREEVRSDRICNRCITVMSRLERDLPILTRWGKEHGAASSPGDEPAWLSEWKKEVRNWEEDAHIIVSLDHDYCSYPEVAKLHVSAGGDLYDQGKDEAQALRVQQEFGLQRFAGSAADIHFYTRFESYDHLMAFWSLIEPCIRKRNRVSRTKPTAGGNEAVVTPARRSVGQLLTQPIDEFFLFLSFLSAGLKERDLAHRYRIHESIVSRIIASWTSFLITVLGSVCIWLTPAEVQAHLPEEFQDFPDTQIILDCTELQCQMPSSQVYSTYKSHCIMRALVGIAPHGAVTFISDLYPGSVSHKEIFKRSGITKLLTEDMAVMADSSLLITDCCKNKVHSPRFLSKRTQMPVHRETRATARLRVHVERAIRRIKQNTLFDDTITLSHAYNINQLFAVGCLLSNYQNKALVKNQAERG